MCDQEIREPDGVLRFLEGSNRPNLGPSQVRSLEELRVDMVVVFHHRRGVEKFKITSSPYQEEGSWRIRGVSEHATSAPSVESISLADYGVVAYSNGMWNLSNWLERVDNP